MHVLKTNFIMNDLDESRTLRPCLHRSDRADPGGAAPVLGRCCRAAAERQPPQLGVAVDGAEGQRCELTDEAYAARGLGWRAAEGAADRGQLGGARNTCEEQCEFIRSHVRYLEQAHRYEEPASLRAERSDATNGWRWVCVRLEPTPTSITQSGDSTQEGGEGRSWEIFVLLLACLFGHVAQICVAPPSTRASTIGKQPKLPQISRKRQQPQKKKSNTIQHMIIPCKCTCSVTSQNACHCRILARRRSEARRRDESFASDDSHDQKDDSKRGFDQATRAAFFV